eukprot:11157946-Lingulodinium_polyedra.AAC.1
MARCTTRLVAPQHCCDLSHHAKHTTPARERAHIVHSLARHAWSIQRTTHTTPPASPCVELV